MNPRAPPTLKIYPRFTCQCQSCHLLNITYSFGPDPSELPMPPLTWLNKSN